MSDDVEFMLDQCMKNDNQLTLWEQGFCDSIEEQLAGDVSLSVKQVDKLRSIFEKLKL